MGGQQAPPILLDLQKGNQTVSFRVHQQKERNAELAGRVPILPCSFPLSSRGPDTVPLVMRCVSLANPEALLTRRRVKCLSKFQVEQRPKYSSSTRLPFLI